MHDIMVHHRHVVVKARLYLSGSYRCAYFVFYRSLKLRDECWIDRRYFEPVGHLSRTAVRGSISNDRTPCRSMILAVYAERLINSPYRHYLRLKGTPCRAIDISHKRRINYQLVAAITSGK